jgi:hypothetical protein
MNPQMKSATSRQRPVFAPKICKCGRCAGCRENDRWELRFQLKFGQQERDYYSEPRRVVGVSANGLLGASMYAMADESACSD